jgi:ferric-chelate reductase (NADPH)
MTRSDIAMSPPGRIRKVFLKLFMREARVGEHRRLSEHFHSLQLEGPALREVAWTAGEKIQISLGGTFATRTYTPTEWDATKGQTHILAYAHGEGPGSDWVRSARVGDRFHLFGPRPSVDVEQMPGGTVLFGDETSLGLALALSAQHRDNPPRLVFEVNSASETARVLDEIGLPNAQVIERDAEDGHFERVVQALEGASARGTIVLTGKAQSIQHVRKRLKLGESVKRPIVARAYWAPGKRGLD